MISKKDFSKENFRQLGVFFGRIALLLLGLFALLVKKAVNFWVGFILFQHKDRARKK